MGIGGFFKALFRGQPPGATRKAQKQAKPKEQSERGKHAASHRRVILVTPNDELRIPLAERLKPIVEAEGYTYEDHPSLDEGIGSQVVILDGTPRTDAKFHSKYDKLVRIKKSMGKGKDLTCVIGRREDYKKYPRGTYPGLLYFCLKGGDADLRDPDLPPEGKDTIEGPRLYNFADLPNTILENIRNG